MSQGYDLLRHLGPWDLSTQLKRKKLCTWPMPAQCLLLWLSSALQSERSLKLFFSTQRHKTCSKMAGKIYFPVSTGMSEKLLWRWELIASRTGTSPWHSQFTLSHATWTNSPPAGDQLTAPLFTRVSKAHGLRSGVTTSRYLISKFGGGDDKQDNFWGQLLNQECSFLPNAPSDTS